jgi:hypothetical protein
MAGHKEILGAYKELKGVLNSLGDKEDWFTDREFTPQANRVIDRIGSVCPEIGDIESYKLQQDALQDGRLVVRVIPTKQKLMGLLGRMEGLYDIGEQNSPNGHTFIQQQSQSQSQHITFVLDLQEKIIKEIPKHAEGTKERSFLEKLKASLPSIKDTTDILSTVLKIAAESNVDPNALLKILGL